LKKRYLVTAALCIALYASPDLRNFATDFLIKGSLDNAGKVWNTLGEKIKNTKLETTQVEIDATLQSLINVNKHILIEGEITNDTWIKQFCRVAGIGSEINIYSGKPDNYNMNLIIDFSKVEKQGNRFIVPQSAIKWLITIPVETKPFSKTNDKYFYMAKTVPLFVATGMINNFNSLFQQKYVAASTVTLVEGGESLLLELPPLNSVEIEMERGYRAFPHDYTGSYKEFVKKYYPEDGVTYEENIKLGLSPILKLETVLKK
jgi:hypothetical protein